MTEPIVSIVITTYNRADVLGEAIESALAQLYPALEVVVVDDGSLDDTATILEHYGPRIVSFRQENRGYAAARNAGFNLARGEYVSWLDSDDIMMPERTALQVAFLNKHRDVVLVSSDFTAFDANGPRRETVRSYYGAFRRIAGGADGIYSETEWLDPASIPLLTGMPMAPVKVRYGAVRRHLFQGSFVHPPTTMMRRDAMAAAGELDITLKNSVEWPYFFRLARQGAFAFIDHPLLRYRYSASQWSGESQSESMALSILRIVEQLPNTEPEMVAEAPALYAHKLATSHLNVADVVAVTDRPAALRSLWKALRLGLFGPKALKVLVKILMPEWGHRFIRRHGSFVV
jgi:glycosyltransferase involved in cell wall biosynthesis